MKVTPVLFYMFAILLSYNGYSQKSKKILIVHKVAEKYAYINVTGTYERIAEKGYKSIDLFQKLGNSFYSDLNMPKAAKWYGELFAMTTDLDSIYYHQYAKSLLAIGENEKAHTIVAKLNSKLNTK